MRNRYTREDYARWEELRRAGYPDRQIAAEAGVAERTIIRWRRRLGLPSGCVEKREKTRKAAMEMLAAGKAPKEIGEALDVEYATVTHWRRELEKSRGGYIPQRRRSPPRERLPGETLCWRCRNTYDGGCPWFTRPPAPVPGWEAVRQDLYSNEKSQESYFVISCPLFEKEDIC